MNISYTQSLLTFDTNNIPNLSSQIGMLLFVVFIVVFACWNIRRILRSQRPICLCYPFCCFPVKVGCFGIFQGSEGDGAFCAPAWSNIAPIEIPNAELMQPLGQDNDRYMQDDGYRRNPQDRGRYMQNGDSRRDPQDRGRYMQDGDSRRDPQDRGRYMQNDEYRRDPQYMPRGQDAYDARGSQEFA
jgi:hypothetical protein